MALGRAFIFLALSSFPSLAVHHLHAGSSVVRNSPEFSAASGSAAPITEDGYKLVAQLHSNKQMEAYVRRLLASEGKMVREEDRGELSGFVPYYSGAISTKSLGELRTELATVPWAVRATNSDVDSALESLKTQRMSSFSDVSAYTLAVAGALAGSHVMTAGDLQRRPIKDLVDELKLASDDKTKVVFQRPDGKVEVTDPMNLMVDVAARPLQNWAHSVEEAKNKFTVDRVGVEAGLIESLRKVAEKKHSAKLLQLLHQLREKNTQRSRP